MVITVAAMTRFAVTSRRARRDMAITTGRPASSSRTVTASAVRSARSLPRRPIARPRSAVAIAGASLTPSPTSSTRRPFACIRRTRSALSAGSSPAWTWLIPTAAATRSAAAGPSPVSSAGARLVSSVRLWTAAAASGRSRSASVITPAGALSTSTTTAVWPSRCACWTSLPARSGAWSAPRPASRRGEPTCTWCAPTRAVTPQPGAEEKPAAGGTASPRSQAADTTARPSGCSLFCSAAAAQLSTRSSSAAPGSARTPTTAGAPSVRVPVLSKATVSARPSSSMTTADLTRMPCRPALAIAASSGGMVASTTAQGEATIMNVIARSSVGRSGPPKASGTANSSTVAATITAEYRCSTRSMNNCRRALLAEACSTRATMRAIADSSAGRLTRTRSAPPFIVPANTSSPACLGTGSASPVMVA